MPHSIRFQAILSIVCASMAIGLPCANAVPQSATPNIVVILADDFGWGSCACYGAKELPTPNIDRLAREGRRFTNAYAPSSVCSPSRYGLMTGRYYWRTSVKDGEVLAKDAPLHIQKDRLTLASLCKSQGYHTAAFGKWHLGFQERRTATNWSEPLSPGPRAIGFDYFYGLATNPQNTPHAFIENEQILGRIPGQVVAISDEPFQVDRIMESLTGKATGWLESHRKFPFFLYFAPNAVHGPITPGPQFTGSRYGSYGDFIQELDWSVGQLLDTLDRLALTENTLVLFTSDNGGIVGSSKNVSEAIEAGLAINGSLRGGKHSEYEGGFREPLIVRWPGRVPRGTVSDQVIGLTDILATLADVLGVALPKGAAEDSFSVLSAFTEAQPTTGVRDHIVLQAANATYALRQGCWKLIERVGAPAYERRPTNKSRTHTIENPVHDDVHDELFNLQDDPAEQHDVSANHAARVVAMKLFLTEARNRGFTRPHAN